MIDCDVIMPGTNKTEELFNINFQAVDSLLKTSDARLIFFDNNSDNSYWSKAMERRVKDLGQTFVTYPGPFNMSRIFNLGTKLTNGKYIVYSNSDVTFYPKWLDNIIDLWEENPHFYSMHPYNYTPEHKGLIYRDSVEPIRKVVPCDHPGSGISVFRRSSGHTFDESFSYWEQDCDYWNFLKSTGKIAGICYNSRVDHEIEGIMKRLNPDMVKKMKEEGTQAYKTKWQNK